MPWWAGSWQVVQRVGRLRVAQGLTSSHTYPTCHLPGSGPPSPTDDLGPAPAPPPALPPTSQASSSSCAQPSLRPSLGQQAPLPGPRAPLRPELSEPIWLTSWSPPAPPKPRTPCPPWQQGLWEKGVGGRKSASSGDPVGVGLAGLRPRPRGAVGEGGDRWEQAGKTNTSGKPPLQAGPCSQTTAGSDPSPPTSSCPSGTSGLTQDTPVNGKTCRPAGQSIGYGASVPQSPTEGVRTQ